MQGQWLGSYQGTTHGAVTIELDDLGDHYEGMAYVFPADPSKFPALAGAVRTADKSLKCSVEVAVDVIDLSRGMLINWDMVKHHYPGVTLIRRRYWIGPALHL
jgi:hypothetical protein